jgi:hypothetical protein
MAVRTTVVGSWWLHPELEEDLARHHAGKLSPQESETVLSRAAAKAIKEQQDLGLDEWSGGEYFTDDFILHMHKCLTGLEVDKPQADEVFDYDDAAHAKVVGKITAPHGLGYLEAFRREKKLPGGVRKAAVVSPFEVVFVAGRDQVDSITPQVPAVIELVNRELRAMADEGCPNGQLDAPIFSAEVNMGMMTPQQAADLIAPCFEGVKATRRCTFATAICAAARSRMRYTAPHGLIFCSAWTVSSTSPRSRSNTSSSTWSATRSRTCQRACNSLPVSSMKPTIGWSRSRKSANECRLGESRGRRASLGLTVLWLRPPFVARHPGAKGQG